MCSVQCRSSLDWWSPCNLWATSFSLSTDIYIFLWGYFFIESASDGIPRVPHGALPSSVEASSNRMRLIILLLVLLSNSRHNTVSVDRLHLHKRLFNAFVTVNSLLIYRGYYTVARWYKFYVWGARTTPREWAQWMSGILSCHENKTFIFELTRKVWITLDTLLSRGSRYQSLEKLGPGVVQVM